MDHAEELVHRSRFEHRKHTAGSLPTRLPRTACGNRRDSDSDMYTLTRFGVRVYHIHVPLVRKKGTNYANTVRILLDCSEICATNAHFMMRNSPVYGSVWQACAQVCNHCAEVCDEIGENDCANACRASAASCEQMAKLIPINADV